MTWRRAVAISQAKVAEELDVTAMTISRWAAVEDEGVGIAASEISRIFEPFYRATSGRKLSCVGIGLALVKRIVTSHDGRVAIASTLGKGTTVTLWFPRA